MTITHDTGTEMLLCEVDDGVATVTFNNPAKRNALSREIRHAYCCQTKSYKRRD
jgi:enoyl-CoA hydratase/carnithine racemase